MKNLSFTKINRLLIKSVLCVLLLGTAPALFAQNEIGTARDPLKIPALWKKLGENPTDSATWSNYYGKNWSAMTTEDLKKIGDWKQQLMLTVLAKQESLVGFNLGGGDGGGVFIDDFAFNELMETVRTLKAEELANKNVTRPTGKNKEPLYKKTQLLGMEAIILKESTNLNELKKNINENFSLIEDLYNELFKQFEVKYVYYSEAHPRGKYHIINWVNDHEKKLKDLKMKQLNQLYKSASNE